MSELALTGGPAVAADLQARAGSWPLSTTQAEAMLDALRSGRWGRLHDDSYAERFESAFAAYQDARHGIAVANGTVSLQLILRTLNIGIGDEVIVPALTFIATARPPSPRWARSRSSPDVEPRPSDHRPGVGRRRDHSSHAGHHRRPLRWLPDRLRPPAAAC